MNLSVEQVFGFDFDFDFTALINFDFSIKIIKLKFIKIFQTLVLAIPNLTTFLTSNLCGTMLIHHNF